MTVPRARRTFDGRGKTVIPGLVDTHAHLHYSGFEFPRAEVGVRRQPRLRRDDGGRPVGASLDVFAQAELVEAGRMLGPRVYSSGDVLYGGKNAPGSPR